MTEVTTTGPFGPCVVVVNLVVFGAAEVDCGLSLVVAGSGVEDVGSVLFVIAVDEGIGFVVVVGVEFLL